MARTTGSDGARTEEAIRRAAIELIAARGFEAMTLRELADRVGVQAGALYRYFPSKSQLLVSLLVEHLEFLLKHWDEERPASGDPVERLRAFVDFHIRSHTLRRREVFVANMELRSLSPAEYRRVVALRRRYEDILTDDPARRHGRRRVRSAGRAHRHVLRPGHADRRRRLVQGRRAAGQARTDRHAYPTGDAVRGHRAFALWRHGRCTDRSGRPMTWPLPGADRPARTRTINTERRRFP